MRLDRKKVILVIVAMFIAVPLIPPVSGDGMPLYTYYETGNEEKELYSTTFESRQLANIVLLNDTHQRIDLFLSIFSMDPRQNLTVLVPFREVPEEVDMQEGTDSGFLDEIDYERIKREGKKQDLSESGGRLTKRTGSVVWDMSTSSITSPIGPLALYMAREYKKDDYDDFWSYGYEDAAKEGGGGGEDYEKNVEEVAHYDFEGASLSVYSVNANATLEDFIDVVDLGTVPTVTREVVEEYRDQFVAVIESEPSPPIEKETYTWMEENMPATLENIISMVREDPTVTYREAQEMTVHYSMQGFQEMVDNEADLSEWLELIGEWDPQDIQEQIDWWTDDEWAWREIWNDDRQPFQLRDKMEKLIFAVYGFTDFSGHKLSITTKLNEGKLYFPLGTSKGWHNPIAENIIICKMDEKTSLSLNLEPDREAFIGDHHYYLFDIPDDNPTEDIEGDIKETTFGTRAKAGFSRFIFNSSPVLAFILGILAQTVIWVLCLMAGSDPRKKGNNPITKRNLVLGLLNIVISAPLTYLLFVSRPFREGENESKGLRISYLIFIGLQLVFIFTGVIF